MTAVHLATSHRPMISSSVPSFVPVARYGVCESAWRMQEKKVLMVAVCGVVRVVAVLLVFPSTVHKPAL